MISVSFIIIISSCLLLIEVQEQQISLKRQKEKLSEENRKQKLHSLAKELLTLNRFKN